MPARTYFDQTTPTVRALSDLRDNAMVDALAQRRDASR
jgi:hypothetical protein